MASFLGNFAKGFMDSYSQGVEDEQKSQREMERERDRIITEKVLGAAASYHGGKGRAEKEVTSRFQRYQTVLQMTGDRYQAVAELVAKTPDIKLDNFEKIRALMNAHDASGGDPNYRATLPDEERRAAEADHARGTALFSEANKILGKSKRGKEITPFQMPAFNPNEFTVQPKPTIELPKEDPTVKTIEYIIGKSSNFYNVAGAGQFLNSVREDAGLPPLSSAAIKARIGGVAFGTQESQRLQMAGEAVRLENPNATPHENRIAALNIALNREAKETMTYGSPQSRVYAKDILNGVYQVAGAKWIPDPTVPGGYMPQIADQARMQKAAAAATAAQKAFFASLATRKQDVLTPMEYAYQAAIDYGLVDPNVKNPLAPLPGNVTPVPDPTGNANPAQAQPTQAKPSISNRAPRTGAPVTDPQKAKPTAGADKPPTWEEGVPYKAVKGNPWGYPEGTEVKWEKGQEWVNMNGNWVVATKQGK